ncbi:RNA-guided endonuclease InsQ/TnpB family protein [Planktothrix agardhii]|jgi:putative transposase|uniref:Transposase in snaA-snaB intergenic region n=3 Tax=Planktothrix agardhii TaxID=1160 RepID=A0AAD1Q433_PLAAG|nr:RNA-guided endonuclease TnpB family protein [Planktothrix agardhii]MCF3605936.1 transposase [Planktothrix agardhii 1033]BBD55705.1 putative transposase [Planktothrix agardhii NIES-204]MCB8749985.1 transposase [Planktothrix agardhii 1810]MCB8758732.1 transposase [Planktothrix agardhii 1813]MCB8765535.1 transposase [Planktothrix agardhii 1809]
MKLRYRYRIYPTDQQKGLVSRLFGCCRVVFNDALAYCQEQYRAGNKKPSSNKLSKRLTELKKTQEKEWLTEVSAIPLQQSLRDLEQAYSNFFKSCKGQRKGKKVKPPKFKKRKSKQSAKFTDNGFKLYPNSDYIYLAKIGDIKVIWSRELPAIPSSVTLIKDSANRYFVSFVVEFNPQQLPNNGKSVGIDLGITDFATLSNGEKVKSPKPLKKQLKHLRRLQQNLSRKQKGSKRREVARKKLARLHAKISDTRNDFLHKLSTKIIRENQTIVLEDLNVSGMVKNRKLSRAISDLGWRSFRTMLEAKSVMYGRDFRVIDRWTPTSQTCSCCGFKGGKKELNVREWICLNCGTFHDRDINAAVNILVAGGLSETLNGRGEKVRLSAKRASSR